MHFLLTCNFSTIKHTDDEATQNLQAANIALMENYVRITSTYENVWKSVGRIENLNVKILLLPLNYSRFMEAKAIASMSLL